MRGCVGVWVGGWVDKVGGVGRCAGQRLQHSTRSHLIDTGGLEFGHVLAESIARQPEDHRPRGATRPVEPADRRRCVKPVKSALARSPTYVQYGFEFS